MSYKIRITYRTGREMFVPGLRYRAEVNAALRAMVTDSDVRQTADQVQLFRKEKMIASFSASTLNSDDVDGIVWPRTGNPNRLKGSRKLSLIMPGVIADELEKLGDGNFSKGLQVMFLSLKPGTQQKELYQ